MTNLSYFDPWAEAMKNYDFSVGTYFYYTGQHYKSLSLSCTLFDFEVKQVDHFAGSRNNKLEQELSFSSTADSRWGESSLEPESDWSETMNEPLDSAPTAEQQETIDLIHWFAYCVLANIFVAIGIVGNILSILVLSRPKLKGVRYVYLLGLAVTNLCVLVRQSDIHNCPKLCTTL